MAIRTLPTPLQDTGLWTVVTPPPPIPDTPPPTPQPTNAINDFINQQQQPQAPASPLGSGAGSFAGSQIANPTPQTPAQTTTAEEQYMVGMQPDQQTAPQPYQSAYSAAPAGTLRNTVEENRQGADSGAYGKLGAGVAATLALGIPAVGLGTELAGAALTAGGPGTSIVERGIGAAARLGATSAAGSIINDATSQIPGYQNLPRPLQTAGMIAPYVLAGPGNAVRKGAEIGAAVIGDEAARFGNKASGLDAPEWMASLIGQGAGAKSFNILEGKAPTTVARILGESHGSGDKAVDDLLGWGKKEDAWGGADQTIGNNKYNPNPTGWDNIDTTPGEEFQSPQMQAALSGEDLSRDGLKSADDTITRQRALLDGVTTGDVRKNYNDAVAMQSDLSPAERQQQMGDLQIRKKELQTRQDALLDKDGFVPDNAVKAWQYYQEEKRIVDTQLNEGMTKTTKNDPHVMQDTVMYGEELYRRTNGAEGIKPRDTGGLKFNAGPQDAAGSDYHAGITGSGDTLASDVAARRDVPAIPDVPHLQDLMNDVDVIKPDSLANGLGRAIVGEFNPSVKRETPLGILGTAIQRQIDSVGKITQGIIRTWYDKAAFGGVSMRDVWQMDADMHTNITDTNGVKGKVLINKVLENPENYRLSPSQEHYVRVVDQILQNTEEMRVRNGLTPRQLVREPRAPGEPKYFPRNVTEMNGAEVPTHASANISRSGITLDEMLANGAKFDDPRAVLEAHVRSAYQEVAIQQQSEMLRRYGLAPSELVPEHIRVAKQKADDAIDRQRAIQKKEAALTQRFANTAVITNVQDAQKALDAAITNKKQLLAEVRGRNASSKITQMPASISTRFAEANALINTAQDTLEAARERARVSGEASVKWTPSLQAKMRTVQEATESLNEARDTARSRLDVEDIEKDPGVKAAKKSVSDAQKAFQKEVAPAAEGYAKGKAGAQRLVSPDTLRETDRLEREASRTSKAYDTAIAEVSRQKALGGQENPGYWDADVVQARQDIIDAEKEYRATQERMGLNHPDLLRRDKMSKNFTDPEIKAAREELRATQQDYQDTLDAAKERHADDPPVIANSMQNISFGSASKGPDYYAPKRDIDQLKAGLDSAFPSPANSGVGRAASAIFNTGASVIRTTATGFDFSVGFVHLLPVLFRDSNAWAQGVLHNYTDLVNPGNFEEFLQKHPDTIQKMARNNLGLGDSELYSATEPGKGISLHFLDKAPGGVGVGPRRTLQQVGKQTIGRAANAFQAAQTVAQTLLWEGMEPSWTGDEAGLAQAVRNVTGSLNSRALGTSGVARNFESLFVALSPRLLRSSVALIGDLRGLGSSDPNARALGMNAFRTLGSMAAGMTALYVGSGYAMGKSKSDIVKGLNPMNGKQFMAHKIDGQWIGFGGVMRGLVQMVAMAGSAAAPGGRPIEDLWAINGNRNPVLKFLISRGAVGSTIAKQLGELTTGANLDNYNKIDNLGDMAHALYKDSLPFTLAAYQDGDSLLGAGANTIGLRTVPTTPSEDRIDDITNRIIPQMQAKGILPPGIRHPEDLGYGEAAAVKAELSKQDPQAVQAWEDFRREIGSIYQDKEDKRQAINATSNKELDRILEARNNGTLDPKAANDQMTNERNQLRGKMELLYQDDPEYQKAIKGFKKNQMQSFSDAYNSIIDNVAKGAHSLTADQWDEVDKQQQSFVTNLKAYDDEHGTQFTPRFQNDLKLRQDAQEVHPLIQAKKDVDDASKTYYNLPAEGTQRADYMKLNPDLNVQRWYMYGDSLQSTDAVDKALNHQGTGLVGQFMASPSFNQEVKLTDFTHPINKDLATWQKDEPVIKKYLSFTPKERALAITVSPQFNALSVYWGHSNKLEDAQATQLFEQKMDAHPTPQWEADKKYITLYYQLPDQNKDKADKEHIRASSPKLDAMIAAFEEAQYGKQPKFYSQAGAQQFYKNTGRSVEKFEVAPPKD